MNRTLLEKVRCLLFTAGMPKTFWGEAVSTAAHLVNKSPSTIINFKCLEEKWTGRKLKLDYLKVLGREAYDHQLEGKLDPRAIKCVFVGYQDGAKGYRLWDNTSGRVKIIIRRDVIFNESIFPCKINNTEDNPTPSSPNDFVIGVSKQIEVEQQDPPAASISQNPYTHDEPLTQDETSDDPGSEEYHTPQQDLSNYQLARDQVRRFIRSLVRYAYSNLVFCAVVAGMEMRSSEPTCYEAVSSHDNTKWKQAMDDEMASLRVNENWKLVPKPNKQKLIKCKWLFKLKKGMSPSDLLKFKSRLVAKDFS